MIEIDLLSKEISAARNSKTFLNTVSFISRMLHNTSTSNGEKDFGDYVLENYERIKEELTRRVGHMFSGGYVTYRNLKLKKDKLILNYKLKRCYVHSFRDSFNGGYDRFRRFYCMDDHNKVFLKYEDPEIVTKFELDFSSFEIAIKRRRENGEEHTADNMKFLKSQVENLSSLLNATMSQMIEVGKPNTDLTEYVLEVTIHKVVKGFETEVILKEKGYFGKKVILAPKGNETEYPITIPLVKSEVELPPYGRLGTYTRSIFNLPEKEHFYTGELLISLPKNDTGYEEVYLVKNEPKSYRSSSTIYDVILLG